MTTNSIDAATLRKWADEARTLAAQLGTGLAAQLARSILMAADAAERDEQQFDADMEAEFSRLFPPLDSDDDVPEVLPVQPRADHEFGCDCPDCCEAAWTRQQDAAASEPRDYRGVNDKAAMRRRE